MQTAADAAQCLPHLREPVRAPVFHGSLKVW
jgi:hypothetical protein